MSFENYSVTREAFWIAASAITVLSLFSLWRMKAWEFAASAVFGSFMFLSFYLNAGFNGITFGFLLSGLSGIILGIGVFPASAAAVAAALFLSGNPDPRVWAVTSFALGVSGICGKIIYVFLPLPNKLKPLSWLIAGGIAPFAFALAYYSMDLSGSIQKSIMNIDLSWWIKCGVDSVITLFFVYIFNFYLPEILPGGEDA